MLSKFRGYGIKREIMGREQFEVINSAELARRLAVKESWVVEASKQSRTNDPIPCIRLGKHRRYLWNSTELLAWLDRRAGRAASTTRAKTIPRTVGHNT